MRISAGEGRTRRAAGFNPAVVSRPRKTKTAGINPAARPAHYPTNTPSVSVNVPIVRFAVGVALVVSVVPRYVVTWVPAGLGTATTKSDVVSVPNRLAETSAPLRRAGSPAKKLLTGVSVALLLLSSVAPFRISTGARRSARR